jgi:ubiquinone/menaquinone biosynthesis C-methylase UbiE
MSRASVQSAVRVDAQQAYQHWASSYDATPNPLLALEERCLPITAEKFFDKDVVELGCGTGRWLKGLEALAPRSLTGVDFSEAMLSEAANKCQISTSLIHSDCSATPLPDNSADFILASFVVSYIQNLGAFSREAARILRPGGTIIISDLHPNTRSYGWRRTFGAGDNLFEIETFDYNLSDLMNAMTTAGCRLEMLATPCFGEEETAIFRQAGKLDKLHQVESLPVIYWARFTCGED